MKSTSHRFHSGSCVIIVAVSRTGVAALLLLAPAMQDNEVSLALIIWQQRAPEAAQMMATLVNACTSREGEPALAAIQTLQSEFVARVFHHSLTAKFMQVSPALLRCVRLLLEACDSLGADVDDDLANYMAMSSCAPNQGWQCVRAAVVVNAFSFDARQVPAVPRHCDIRSAGSK